MTYYSRRDRNLSNCKSRRYIKRIWKMSSEIKKKTSSRSFFKGTYKRNDKQINSIDNKESDIKKFHILDIFISYISLKYFTEVNFIFL